MEHLRGVQQRIRMGEILNKLLPKDMVDLVLAQHFQFGNETLPIKLCRSAICVGARFTTTHPACHHASPLPPIFRCLRLPAF